MWNLTSNDLEQTIKHISMQTVLYATIIIIVVTILSLLLAHRIPKLKLPLFVIMAGTVIVSTFILLGNTVYLNVTAESKGPVHWHSDIEFWVCGTEIELRDPQGFLSNKIGSSTYHEHDDKRIHLEGVVIRKDVDASLEKFMRVTGGYVTNDRLGIPLNESAAEWFASEANDKVDGDTQPAANMDYFTDYVSASSNGKILELVNGPGCNSDRAEVQTFVYRYDKATKTYSQHKLANPGNYIMRDEGVVPPGDCVIVEYDTPKELTDKLCLQYGVRDSMRCTEFGVKEYDPGLCNLTEIPAGARQ